MYEVTTITKTIATKVATEAEAVAIAEIAFKTSRYVEVKRIASVAPWYAVSVRIFSK